jgi:tetratricopeptide (TPR) repeat protein
MAKKSWTEFPYSDKAYHYTAATAKKAWGRLHKGNREPFPEDKKVLQAWLHFHAGEFAKAVEEGLAAGAAGFNVANHAQNIYANYLEEDEAVQLKLFQEVASRCEARMAKAPGDAFNCYLHAYALGRYSQGISVVKALAQGLGGKIQDSLTRALELNPEHADAHVALGTYHAEVIDKVGSLMGGLTYGVKEKVGLEHYRQGLELFPESAIYRIEYANGLVMLKGRSGKKEADALYREAAALQPMDAMERLDVELAKAELEA